MRARTALLDFEQLKEGIVSNTQERVLGRRGARELSDEEARKIQGGISTTTVCTIPNFLHPNGDGDKGECI